MCLTLLFIHSLASLACFQMRFRPKTSKNQHRIRKPLAPRWILGEGLRQRTRNGEENEREKRKEKRIKTLLQKVGT